MSLYFDDIMKIITRLHQKQVERGYQNREIDLKFKKIKARLDKIKRGDPKAGKTDEYFDTEKAREDIRRFVYEEFVKKMPDEISFKRPDSGSGVFEEEEDQENDEDYDSWASEDDQLLNELEEIQFERKSRTAAKSRRSRKSINSRGSNNSHKTAKTHKTNKSHKSNKS